MNHCGRPECECYKKCWYDCDLCSEATGINHAGHTDKPVQQGQSCLHCEKPVRVGSIEEVCMCPERQADGSWKPVQEKRKAALDDLSREAGDIPPKGTTTTEMTFREKNCSCKNLEPSDVHFKDCPVVSDAEEWEKVFFERFGANKIWVRPSRENVETILEIWAFFRSAIEQAEKRGENKADWWGERLEDAIASGKKQERSRISEAIRELKKYTDRRPEKVGWTFMDERDEAHNAAIDAILKVIHEV